MVLSLATGLFYFVWVVRNRERDTGYASAHTLNDGVVDTFVAVDTS